MTETEQLAYSILTCNVLCKTTEERVKYIDNKLKAFVHSIIDKCAGSFECDMEKCVEGDWYDNMYEDEHGDYVYPVLNRQSILDIKNMY
jgi:hypothetical protein